MAAHLGNGSIQAQRVGGVWSGSANFDLLSETEEIIGRVVCNDLAPLMINTDITSPADAATAAAGGPITVGSLAIWASAELAMTIEST